MSSRLIASQIIQQSVEEKLTLSIVLNNNDSFKNAGKERALIQEISYGTFRWYIQLEHILDQLLEKRIKKKDSSLKYLIMIGLYQLRFMRIPAHAVVSETVNTCKKINMVWAKGLVNAILRRYIRESAQLDSSSNANETAKFSHPKWLIELLKKDWPDEWQNILEANNQRPPMYLRVNQLRQDRESYLKKLNEAGIEGKITPYSSNGILLDKANDVDQLPGFNSGEASVQELAAQLSAELLDLKSGQNVLDACAAPGGKSAHILETQAKLNSLTSIEKDPNRTIKLSETLKRLDLSAIIKTSDINDIEQWWDKTQFDRILLDVPCSATGVIRRHPDIKILRTKEEVNAIQELQTSLLNTLWPTLKTGGLLLYVTCSILKDENSNQIKKFIANNKDCYLKPIKAKWGVDTGYGRQILTGQDNMDGFFYACLEKN
ncbi:MAG: 16S rRNA (cytosine(967)-C(5))-methyltransferase RsmB [Proteobacteria bacterium]|nr:16S rRNA (cytosine(967)-C(5))-methyltransferase RsmB [Pseudomonadota bacterium]NOG60227.1 16S rRNA (cytosine(967)-C(5))-methyltransferase RsmB [Pseudomonadota bacterium]